MAAVHRVRERLIAQRTQTINMLRGQMAEFGMVAAKSLPRAKAGGPQHVKGLVAELVEPESVPEPLRQVLLGLVRLLTALREQIAALDKQILAWHRANPCSLRLSGIDGFGPILSSALALRVQQPQRFACGRDLAAPVHARGRRWIGPCSCQGQALDRPLFMPGAGSGTQAELLRRQGSAGGDQQEGRCLSAPTADQQPALGLDPMGRPGGAQQQTGQGRPLDRAVAAD